MRKRCVLIGLALVLFSVSGTVVNAADQPAATFTGSWTEDLAGVYQPVVIKQEVVKLREFGAGGAQAGFYLNVMQDCWTTDEEEVYLDPEMENYLLFPDNVVFVWKHKIFEGCSNYIASIVGLPCENGKPPVIGRVAWIIQNIPFGDIQPGAEYLFWVQAGGLPEGTWDWFVVTECHDTNGSITPPLKDGDIDDVIGANLGKMTYPPLVYGPEPVEVLDPHPGGLPPGRLPGEEGSCRCWCFTVEAEPQCPSIVGTWDLTFDWWCDSLEIRTIWIQFNSDGTFDDEEYNSGTWTQNGCDVDWYYDNQTHYWGVETYDGMYMEGDMLTTSGMDGCWWADRTSRKAPSKLNRKGITAAGEKVK